MNLNAFPPGGPFGFGNNPMGLGGTPFGPGGGLAPMSPFAPGQGIPNQGIPTYLPYSPMGLTPELVQANQGVDAAVTGLPAPIGNLLNMNRMISNWSANNPDPLEQPSFTNAFNQLFGPGQNQIAGTVPQGVSPFGVNPALNSDMIRQLQQQSGGLGAFSPQVTQQALGNPLWSAILSGLAKRMLAGRKRFW